MVEKELNTGYAEQIEQSEANISLPTSNRVRKAIAIVAIGLSSFGAHKLTDPASAEAKMQCTTVINDGVQTTECSEESASTNGEESTPSTPPSTVEPKEPKTPSKPKQPKPEKKKPNKDKNKQENSQKIFPGYNMSDSSFTDGNGCFITAAASALRRETGNKRIKPQNIYYPALQRRWSPSGGVNGFLFDALPAMAARHNVKVWDTNFKGALKAKKNGDEVMILAEPGHFTSVGHYMAVRGVTWNGRKLILDDPNGRGRHGDSERKIGWNGKQLKQAGVIDYRVLHYKR